MSGQQTWYFEYKIVRDRIGLLGDVATLFGMLGINIQTVNSLGREIRGFLLQADEQQTRQLLMALANFESIEVTCLRQPSLVDYICLRHGKAVSAEPGRPPVFRFLRSDLDVVIDLMASYLADRAPVTIGLRGSPNVGKTEATVAACVYANKRWVVVSGTIFRQVLRTDLDERDYSADTVLLIDAITSAHRPVPEHRRLIGQVLARPVNKVIEHPDIFLREGLLRPEDLDVIIEVRAKPEDEICYDRIPMSVNSFDCS